jgi:hypothetical protein
VLDAFGERRGWLAGLGLGVASLVRANVILAAPLFAYLLVTNKQPGEPRQGTAVLARRALAFLGGLGSLTVLNALYNWGRFGSPTDNGYARFVQAGHHPAVSLFSASYFWTNLKGYLTRLPVPGRLPFLGGQVPWLDPTLDGFSIFLGMPALVLALRTDYRDRRHQLALLTIAMIMSVYMLYYWSGFAQFGRRYFLDALPFAMVLIAGGARRSNAGALALTTSLGVLVEVWGITWWHVHGLGYP